METVHLLKTPAHAAHLEKSIQQFRRLHSGVVPDRLKYLPANDQVRGGKSISTFSKIGNLGSQLPKLRMDIDTGVWEQRYGTLRDLEFLDLGYRLVGDDQHYIRVIRSRSALPITETELRLMAAAAMMGLKRMPKAG